MSAIRSRLDVELTEQIATGPNSVLYLALDRCTYREVVVKQIRIHHDKLSEQEAHQELRVAQTLCRLPAHPNLVYYHAGFAEAGLLWLVMEPYRGGDLYAFLESQPDQRLDENNALEVWQQIVQAVGYLHRHGIAHRDLSLENILVDEEGVPKVCDFGLSTFIEKDTLAAGQVGKAYYMAPEVVAGDEYDAVQADVWSLGVILFILLTGSPLVQIATSSDPVLRALQTVGVQGILRHWRMDHHVSLRCMDLLDRMLQVSPSQRAKSTEELLEWL